MPKYDLNKLSDSEFESLFQSLLKEVIGLGTITFGVGPDGGREATYSGEAPYPSTTNKWSGNWVFQSKYHDINIIGSHKARQEVLKDLKSELNKTLKGRKVVDNYILATNVPLSSSSVTGSHDRISELVSRYQDKIKNVHVWDYFEICSYLDIYPEIRKAYPNLLTLADLKGDYSDAKKEHQDKNIRPILECWLSASLWPKEYLYGSEYDPIFLPLYVTINNFERCDPYNEAKMHLETGYPDISDRVDIIQFEVDKYNQNVSIYARFVNTRVRTKILYCVSSLKECDSHSILLPQSYYLSNILTHFKNAYPENRVTLKIESGTKNSVNGWILYSDGIEIAFGDKPCLDSLKTFIEQHTRIIIEEIKGHYEKIKEIEMLLDGFCKDVKELVPKSKYGNLAGRCEFEKTYEDL